MLNRLARVLDNQNTGQRRASGWKDYFGMISLFTFFIKGRK
jgi:hypothetical protein